MITYLADTTQEQRGMLRAATEGVRVKRTPAGIWLASSISRPGQWHVVQGGRCDCEGFAATGCCKHLMATRLAEESAGEAPCRRCGTPYPVDRLTSDSVCGACAVGDLFGKE